MGGLAEERSWGETMAVEGDGSGYVWAGGADSRRLLRGGGLIPSEEVMC